MQRVLKQPFLVLTIVSSLVAIATGVAWRAGVGAAEPASLVAWGIAGVFAFVSGWRGERPWKIHRLIRATVFALAALTATLVGLAVVGFRTESKQVETAPAVTDQKGRVALISAAARQAHRGRIVSVLCEKGAKAEEIGLSTCAVTFAGPACQLWIVINTDGEDKPMPFSEPAEGRRGSYDTASGMSKCVEG